jgi:hypothetical protein
MKNSTQKVGWSFPPTFYKICLQYGQKAPEEEERKKSGLLETIETHQKTISDR